jgi:hypothetical protein
MTFKQVALGNTDAEAAFPNAHYPDRKLAIQDIMAYVLQFPETRIVPISTMIAWMKSPKAVSPVQTAPIKSQLQTPAQFAVRMVSPHSVLFSLPSSGLYTFSILTLQGQTIEKQTACRSAGKSIGFPIRKSLSAGAYIFGLSNGSGIVLQKIVERR